MKFLGKRQQLSRQEYSRSIYRFSYSHAAIFSGKIPEQAGQPERVHLDRKFCGYFKCRIFHPLTVWRPTVWTGGCRLDQTAKGTKLL